MRGFDSIQIPEQREVLIAFSDLKDFTPFVRDLDEAHLFAVLSDYYELIGDIVTAGGGKVVIHRRCGATGLSRRGDRRRGAGPARVAATR